MKKQKKMGKFYFPWKSENLKNGGAEGFSFNFPFYSIFKSFKSY